MLHSGSISCVFTIMLRLRKYPFRVVRIPGSPLTLLFAVRTVGVGIGVVVIVTVVIVVTKSDVQPFDPDSSRSVAERIEIRQVSRVCGG
jgi:hypothetical protein